MDLEGALFDFEGAFLHSLPKSGGAMAPLAPPVPTSLSVSHTLQSFSKLWLQHAAVFQSLGARLT